MTALPDELTNDEPTVSEHRVPLDFETWAADHGPDLMRFAVAVTGNRHDAADAVQDALVALYGRWRRVSTLGSPDAYARRIIVNGRISWWRRIGRREAAEPPPERAGPGPAGDLGDAVLAERLLRALPRQQRAAVALRYLDDLSFTDIAAILQCPESTARSHVHRALKHLRTELGDDHD